MDISGIDGEQLSPAFIEKLKNQHLAFLMAEIKGDNLKKQVTNEIDAAYKWLNSTRLHQLIDIDWVKAFVHRAVRNAPYTQRLHEMIVKGILVGINAEINREVSISALVPKDEFDDLIRHLAQYEEVRVDVIRAVLQSPLYSELISDVLYYGIKDYVVNENLVTKKVPGVSSLMKMGAKSINKAMPNLENMAESAVKKYIESNISRTLSLSEKILNNSLNEDNIKKVADHFWQSVESKEFSLATKYVDEQSIDEGAELAKRLWLQLREADYIHNMIDVVIDFIFAEYGQDNVAAVLDNLGFDQAYVTEEVQQHLPELLARDAIHEFIESRLNESLERFYQSI